MDLGIRLETIAPNRRMIWVRTGVRIGGGTFALCVCLLLLGRLSGGWWLLCALCGGSIFLVLLFYGMWELQYLTQIVELWEHAIELHERLLPLGELDCLLVYPAEEWRLGGLIPTGRRFERIVCRTKSGHRITVSGMRFIGPIQAFAQAYEDALPVWFPPNRGHIDWTNLRQRVHTAWLTAKSWITSHHPH